MIPFMQISHKNALTLETAMKRYCSIQGMANKHSKGSCLALRVLLPPVRKIDPVTGAVIEVLNAKDDLTHLS
jgi:hypothetical protein